MSATLKVTREGTGIELRRGIFDVCVDDKWVGSIEAHGSLEASLEPGHHILRVQAGRYSSHAKTFDVADDEVVNYRCHGAWIWPMYVASIFKPDLAISLRRE